MSAFDHVQRSARVVSLALLTASLAEAAPPSYEMLRAARPDGRQVAVSELVLARDAFTLTFTEGVFHLLGPVEGRTYGAVFLGRGSFVLAPADPAERAHLDLLGGGGSGTLQDSFDTLALLFADSTEQDVLAGGVLGQQASDVRADAAWADFLERMRRGTRMNLHMRVLRHALNDGTTSPAPFFAFAKGGKLSRSLIAIDPSGMLDDEQVCLFVDHETKGGYWYAGPLASGPVAAERRRPVDPQHYDVDTRIERDTDLRGTTTVRFKVHAPKLALLAFDLLPSLRIEGAELLDGDVPVELSVVQEGKDDDAEPAVVFPVPLTSGQEAILRVRYGGDGVLARDGDGVFSVGARSSWYANLGAFQDVATFDLTYHVPEGNEVVSVGERIEAGNEGKTATSRWKVEHPASVAGFNYGRFKRVEQTESNTGMQLQVFTNPGTPDIIQEINQYLTAASSSGSVQSAIDVASTDTVGYNGTYRIGPSRVAVNTESLAASAMADAINSVQVYTALFGPLPTHRLAITQQSEWSFGQAWPTLVFLPYLAAFDSRTRADLGISGTGHFIDEVTPHEIAHQWWGHLVGWDTYRDQWLSEGFAEFSAAMLLELTRGREAYDAFWERGRQFILDNPRGSTLANHEAGPISLGFRLATDRAPWAYFATVYSKGGYVLHMLRTLMREDKAADPDARFFAMMRDFVSTHAGTNASTDDFKRVIERHMIPELNGKADGRMDWFFDQWVHGTAIPRYTVESTVEKAGKGQYRFYGRVTQEGVSDDFLALVPMYLEFGRGEYGLFGRAPFKGNMSRDFDMTLAMPAKPKRVVANAQHEVLARD